MSSKSTRRSVKRQALLARSSSPKRSEHKPLRLRDVKFDNWTGKVRAKEL